jgi:Ni,Fe-hydrogenase III small subunit
VRLLIIGGVPPHPKQFLPALSRLVPAKENNEAKEGGHCDEREDHTAT